MSNKTLLKRIDTLLAQIEQRRQAHQDVHIKTRWGNEEGPTEAGVIVIRTNWGTPKLGDDNE